MAGRQALALLVGVRILLSQPARFLHFCPNQASWIFGQSPLGETVVHCVGMVRRGNEMRDPQVLPRFAVHFSMHNPYKAHIKVSS